MNLVVKYSIEHAHTYTRTNIYTAVDGNISTTNKLLKDELMIVWILQCLGDLYDVVIMQSWQGKTNEMVQSFQSQIAAKQECFKMNHFPDKSILELLFRYFVPFSALFTWNTLLAGTMKSFGVLYLEFLELYQRGPVATAWIGCTFSLVLTLMGKH